MGFVFEFGIFACVGDLGGGEVVFVRFHEETGFIDTPSLLATYEETGEEFPYHICFAASSLEIPLSVAIASRTWSAILKWYKCQSKASGYDSYRELFKECSRRHVPCACCT